MTEKFVKNSFSIVIPCLNEEKYIENCIQSVLNQNYSSDLVEIIIVDGLSTDNTPFILARLKSEFKNILLIQNPERKTPISLNLGIKKAKNDYIIVLGAHAELDSNFLFYNNKYLNEKGVKVVGGTQINRGRNYIQNAIGYAMESPFGMASAPYRWSKKEKFVDTVVYAAYKRELFEEVGGFEEKFTISEDAELNWRIRNAGYKIFFSPEIKTYYKPRSTLIKFSKQMFRYGILRVNVLKKHINSIKLAHIIPPVFTLTLLIFLVLSITGVNITNVLMGFLIIYFAINIVITFFQVFPKKINYLLVIPVINFLMHFLWGLGFVIGFFLPRSKRW